VPFSWRYIPPNAITCASLGLGVASVGLALHGQIETACWLVLMSVLLDKADGTVARLLHASSPFGVQLDSFSDFTTFGLAPAFVLLGIAESTSLAPALGQSDGVRWAVRAVAVLYAVFTALRLAKFNVMSERNAPAHFLGLPTTLSGAMLASYTITALRQDFGPLGFEVLPVIYAVFGGLMVTNFAMPKLSVPKGQPWRTLVIASVASAYAFGFTWQFPEYLLGLSVFFAVFGFTYGALYLKWPQESAGHHEEAPRES
jgi:CDP-diacylglycerol--serine O-phosphatidyltransferase